MKQIDGKALTQLKAARHLLRPQEYRTLKGQVLNGDPDGAMRGLRNLLRRREEERRKA